MKKNMIALLLSIVMTAGSIGGTPALAAETTAEETVVVEEETIEEATEIPEEADAAESVDAIEEEPSKDATESAEDIEKEGNAELPAEDEELSVDAEEVETEDEVKDAALVEAEDIVDSGECGENVTWTLTGTGDNLTLTISGSGAMRDYDVGFDIFPTWNSYKSEIKTVVIEDGVTIIGADVFYDCTNLTNITIPDSVTGIKSRAFSHCSSLTSITIPDSVMSIGGSAFQNCTYLTDITIPNGITSIGYAEFAGCSSLTSITIPDSVTSIEHSAFSQCKRLTSITIPDSVTSIREYAFNECKNLTSITIPASVTSIGHSAFYGCTKLTDITIPDGVKGIPESVFRGCSSLTSISIPDSVTSIGRASFYGCSKLRSINIPVGVTSIGWESFYGCSSLTSITIPENETSIGQYVFYKCSSLTTITIPEHVTSIGQYAFYGCTGLKKIYFNGDAPTYFGNNCFNGVTANAYYIDNSTWTENVKKNYGGNITWIPYGPETIGAIEIDPEFTCNIGEQIQISATYRGTNEITSATVSADPDDSLEFSGVSIQGPVDNGNGQEMIISFMVTANKDGNYNLTLTASDGTSATTVLKVVDEYDIAGAEVVLLGVAYTNENGIKCFDYTGNPIEPVYSVRLRNKPIAEKEVDYTITYVDNTEIGTARWILEGIGDYHGQKTVEFLIVPDKIKELSASNESEGVTPGEVVLKWNGLKQTNTIEIECYRENDDSQLVEGYPIEMINVISTDSSDDSGSLLMEYTYHAGGLEEETGYRFRVRQSVTGRDGKLYASDWTESIGKTSEKSNIFFNLGNPYILAAGIVQIHFDFIITDSDFLRFTGKGAIRVKDESGKDVFVIGTKRNDDLLEGDDCSAELYDDSIEIKINTAEPGAVSASGTPKNKLVPGKRYYVTIDPSTIAFDCKNEYIGCQEKERWTFETLDFEVPSYKNSGYHIPESYYRAIYKPGHMEKLMKDQNDPGNDGVCYGICSAALAWNKGYPRLKSLKESKGIEHLGNMPMDYTDAPDPSANTLFNYIVLQHLVQFSKERMKIKNKNSNDIDTILKKVDGGEYFLLDLNAAGQGHTVIPLGYTTDDYDGTVMLYCYNCGYLDTGFGFVNTLKISRVNGKLERWYWNADLNTNLDDNNIAWIDYDVSYDEIAEKQEGNLLYSNTSLKHRKDAIRIDNTGGDSAVSSELNIDEGYLYWYEGNEIEESSDSNEPLRLYLNDGYKSYSGTVNGGTVFISLEDDCVRLTPNNEGEECSFTIQNWEDYDESTKIKVTAGGSEQTTLKQTDDGWTLEGAQPGTITITMESEGVEDGEEITNTEEITVESTTGSVEMENDSDQTLHVYEDLDGDGSKDTEIGTVAMPHRPGITSIENASISGIEDKEYTGNALTQEPVVTVKGRTLVSGKHYTVSYENNINVGTAKVIITGTGKYTGTIEKEFEITAKEIIPTIILSKRYFIFNRKEQKPNVTVKDGDTELIAGRDYTIRFPSDCTLPKPHRLVVDLKGNYSGSNIATFWIGSARIILPSDTYVYSGKAIKPTFTVKFGTIELTSSDYDVIWPDGCTKVGTYTVTVKLKGAYSGTVTKSYEITAKKITPTVTLSPKTYVYNGKVRKPAVTVKNGSSKLATSNYTVTYSSGRKNPGTYKIVVKMKGNYSGSKAVSFKINPKGTVLVSLTPASKKMTVKWKKQATQTTGYQIQYATDSKFTKNKKSVTIKGATNTSKLITGLTGGKKYYVRIRTYKTVAKANYYSAWSAAKTVTIKK